MGLLKASLTFLSGLFAGVLTGLMGSSGVMIVVPSMTLLGYSVHSAVAISLAVDMIASVVVAVTYYRHGQIDIRRGAGIAVTAVAGALIGSQLSQYIPAFGLGSGYGILLFVSAVPFWRRGAKREQPAVRDSRITRYLIARPWVTAILFGLGIGAISGMFGVGGGILFLFALLLLGYPLHKAIGTSTLIMALTTASGTVGHARLGHLPVQPVILTTVGTVAGSFGAAWVANHLSARRLGRLIALVFVGLGIAMFVAPLLPAN